MNTSMTTELLMKLLAAPLHGRSEELRPVARNHDVLRYFVNEAAVKELNEVFHSEVQNWRERVPLPMKSGTVMVPVSIDYRRPLPLAAEAALLPIHWTDCDSDSENVPRGLQMLAQDVLEHARRSPRLRDQYGDRLSRRWTIQWALDAWQKADFSDLPLSPESAYAPLSVGLVSAISGLPLIREFFCTGQWNAATASWNVNRQTLERKLGAAIDLGLRRFVVPASSSRTLEHYLEGKVGGERVELQTAVLRDDPDLDAAIADANVIAGWPPKREDSLEVRERWYDSIRDESTAREFYDSHLIDDAKEAASEQLEKSDLHQWSPDTLVSLVSHSSELIRLAALTFRPKRCILIHTDEQSGGSIKQALCDLRNWFGQDKGRAPHGGPDYVQVSGTMESLDKIVEVISEVPRGAVDSDGKSGVLIDVTPGKRTMILAMLQGARAGDRVLCWWHDTAPHNRRAIPSSVQPLIWKVQVSGGLVPLCPPCPRRDRTGISE